MSAPRPKPRLTRTTVIIYAATTLMVIVMCAIIGCAMDFSANINGKIDYSKLGISFQRATNNGGYIIRHLIDKNSNV